MRLIINDHTIEDIEEEYNFKFNQFNSETCEMLRIALNSLSITDRRILILYSELKSLRKVAALLYCSYSTVYKRIKKIKKQIYDIPTITIN